MTRTARVVVAVAVAAGMWLVPAVAGAQISGPCEGTLEGTPLTGGPVRPVSADEATTKETAVKVDADDVSEVTGTMSSGPVTYKIQLEIFGIKWTARKGTSSGATWTGNVNIKDYARYAAGVYKVIAKSTNPAGQSCTAEAYVEVTGKSGVTTAAGLTGLGLSIVGVVLVVSNVISLFRKVV